jgi:hypothetical protein
MTKNRGFIFTAIFGLILTINANATMVSFYLIETGLSENAEDNQLSFLWENAFMDVFFDAGFIVSNAPILRMPNKPVGDIMSQVNMTAVRNAGIDYLLIAQLDFTVNGSPCEITFYIYKVNPREKILERQIQGRESRPSREEFEYMKAIARGLIRYIP